jgi:hypothetical protein
MSQSRAAGRGRKKQAFSKAAANIENVLAGFDQELRRDMPLFGELRSFEIENLMERFPPNLCFALGWIFNRR